MLKIRLTRFGVKSKPTYRLTVAEHTKDAHGDVLEYLGSYNPRSNPKMVQLNADRIKYWLSVGAQASATVHNLLISQKVIEGAKVRAWRPKIKEQKPTTAGAAAPEDKKPVTTQATAPAATPAPAEKPTEATPTEAAKPE